MKKYLDKFKFIIFNLIIAALLLGILELLVLHLLNNPSKIPNSFVTSFRDYYRENDRSTIQVVPECGKYDPELFYTLRPGTCTFTNREFSNQFKINKLGVRDDAQSLEFPQIITTGDSFTMGWGVENEGSFPKLLEDTYNLNLLNSAVSSYGTVREMKIIEGLSFDSLQTLIIQYHPNDFIENEQYSLNNNELIVSSEEVYNHTVNEVKDNTSYYFGKFTSQILKHWMKNKVKEEASQATLNEKEAVYFINALSNSNLPLEKISIVVFELTNYNEPSGFIKQLKSEIRKAQYPEHIKQIEIIDMSNYLKEEHYYILDNHLNAEGHEVVANTLKKYIKHL